MKLCGAWVMLALITSLDLKPKVEKGTAFSNGFAVQVNAHVCLGRNRSDETFTAKSTYH
jgi:hypothetical protein